MPLPVTFTPQLLRQLELQQLKARKSFLGSRQGAHYSPKRGHGIEFSDFRQYQPGDDLRHIDWNLVARSERFYIKRFREEQDLLVHLILDNSASMFSPSTDKWNRVVELALAIGYLSSMQQDRLQLAVPGHFIGKKYSGKNLVYKLSDDLAQVQINSAKTFDADLKLSFTTTNFPGVAYYISDFLDDPEKIKANFQTLLARNLDLRVIQVLTPEEITPRLGTKVLAVDSETGQEVPLEVTASNAPEYQQAFAKHQKDWQDFSYQRQIAWYSCDTSQDLAEICRKILGVGK